MKRSIIIILTIVLTTVMVSCGASWEQTKKDFVSDLGGGLERKITVTNLFNGEVVWSYEGKSYIDDCSTVGDVTIIYYDSRGNSKKADFLGQFYGVESIEL